MPDREKVIKGLECCTGYCDEETGCPYYDPDNEEAFACEEHLRRDAIALLKAQEPRVMTLEEMLALKENTPVYVENCDGLHGWDVFAGPDYDDGYEYVMTGAPWAAMDYWQESEYNDTWRCWTSRPADAQREAEPWN